MKNNEYTAKDISVLNDIDYVRLRTHNYFGDTSLTEKEFPVFNGNTITTSTYTLVPAALKALDEIIDNCIDEFHEGSISRPCITIWADPANGHFSIGDNGRGVPIEKHPAAKKHVPEVVFGMLKSGRNFKDNKKTGVRGQNGVGSACVNFCSTEFKVNIARDGKKYSQTFVNGLIQSKPSIRSSTSRKTGTTIEFTLDPDVFKSISLPVDLIISKCYEIAISNPKLQVKYSDTHGNKFQIKYSSMVEGLRSHMSGLEHCILTQGDSTVAICPNFHQGDQDKTFGWINSGYLMDGGLCNSQFTNAVISFVEGCISSSSEIKKLKKSTAVDKNLIKKGLGLFLFTNVSDPQYDAQHKSRYTGPTLRKEYDNIIDQSKKSIERRLKPWLNQIEQDIIDRMTQGASNALKKKTQQRSQQIIPGFLDATTKKRSDTYLLITEGKSASGEIKNVRNSAIHAVYELRGKVNNVHGSTAKQLSKMGKLEDLLAVLNLVPGQKAAVDDLNVGHIVISTDADYDGDDIFTLLVNMFYQFWPELLTAGQTKVYRLVAPNIVASKGQERIHFQTREEFKKVEHKYKNYTIEYMKGLGSMNVKDWNQLLENLDQRIIPIEDDGNLGDVLDLLFNDKRPDDRKEWLGDNQEC